MHKPIYIAAYHQSEFGKLMAMTVPEIVNASVSGVCSLWSSPATTRTMGSENAVANSKSRSSCPGTAMMAPVPYSMST